MPTVSNGPGAVALGAADRVRAVAAVKARLRLVSVDEDALIAAFAESALGLAERVVGQVLIARQMSQLLAPPAGVATMRGTGGWHRLGAEPVRAIDAVTDADGAALPVADYAVDIDGDGAGWVRLGSGRAARVTFTAGLAEDWDALPVPLSDGAAMLAAHLFDDRTGQAPVPAAVGALWRPFRVLRLGAELHGAARA